MKMSAVFKAVLVSVSLVVMVPWAPAQSVTVTTSAGTVSEFDPDYITVRTERSVDPIRYRYTRATRYVDEEGNPVSVETVRSGLPVTVHYTVEGDRKIADRVIVSHRVPVAPARVEERITTTNTAGTLSEFSPDSIVVRAEGEASPIRYTSTKRTTYVDEGGNPVSVETVRSGLPVTVYYSREGDRLIADRVVVTKRTIVPPPANNVIQKRTTTTTTVTTEPGRVRNEKD